jgi:tetratricopeptide (TPR) repeat protein
VEAATDKPHEEILRLIRARDWRAAKKACHLLNKQHPEFAAGWHSASQIALSSGAATIALSCSDRALVIESTNPRFLLQRAYCLLALGRTSRARKAAAAAEANARGDAGLLDAIGSLYSRANDHRSALAAYDEAVILAPNNPYFIFNRATVLRLLGDSLRAETDYDRVIALNPNDYEAYKNRSELRTQTPDRNHVSELERLVAQNIPDWRAEVQLHHALAKEYEDLGEYDQAFRSLQRGASARRKHLKYDVAIDVATVDSIIETYPVGPVEAEHDQSNEAPIFIVGLPRSGTTLVDRILGSHSMIVSDGELDHFAQAIVDAVRHQSGKSQLSRLEIVAQSAMIDFAALGRDYVERAYLGGTAIRFTDKMPLNYLYCGLIRRALPNAKIVHVARNPMAACFAMYKTLFRHGYPFSYDLAELGKYYLAYRRLMEHWQVTMPGFVYSVSYERLLADPLSETRKLLDYCALAWEDACANVQQKPSPMSSASASEVRQGMSDSSVSQWRHYETQLAPLGNQLHAAGVAPE